MIVVAGLDPATHLFRETLFEVGWIRGSSPRMTAEKYRSRLSDRRLPERLTFGTVKSIEARSRHG
jgi:hypothetical protein